MREISATTREQSSGIEQVNVAVAQVAWIRWRNRMQRWWKSLRQQRVHWKSRRQAQSMAAFKL